MGRKRKNPEDEKLPTRVYKDKYSYCYKPNSKEYVVLGPLNMTMAQVWTAYEVESGKRKNAMTFSKLWFLYLDGAYYSELAPRTQKDYLKHQKKLLAVFGEDKADLIKPEHVRQFLDRRGKQSKTQANHEFASMSRVYRWGYERGYVKNNPCAGVTKYSLKSRDIYISDDEYLAIYNEGIPLVQIGMEISYLCAARIGDVLKMDHSQILQEGIFIKQGKTGKKQIKKWTVRLRAAIDKAIECFPPKYTSDTVLKNFDGNPCLYKTFNTHFVEARTKAEIKLGKELKCTFHDIKAKGISDFEGSSKDKQLFSGHKTESQVVVYDRKTKITPSLDLPIIEK